MHDIFAVKVLPQFHIVFFNDTRFSCCLEMNTFFNLPDVIVMHSDLEFLRSVFRMNAMHVSTELILETFKRLEKKKKLILIHLIPWNKTLSQETMDLQLIFGFCYKKRYYPKIKAIDKSSPTINLTVN